MHKSLIGCAFALVLAASDVDWKLYGTASDMGIVCFYDAKGVVAQPTLRVWAKCLLQKDLDSVDFDSKLGKKIVDSSARKVIKGYIPPIAIVEDTSDHDAIIDVIQYEEIANLSNIQPQARFFYELNCSERMIRRLTTYVRDLKSGKEGFFDMPSSWEYVPPEGNAASLLKILCR